MIREATYDDIPRIIELIGLAIGIMRSDGNMTQWADGYPDEAAIRRDIDRAVGHVVCRDSDQPVAYFALIPSPEPTYAEIEGSWLDDDPYYVIHRIASTPTSHGVLHELLEYSSGICPDIRIDTHEDNRIMRHSLEREGFAYCGVIYLADGAPRLAFQKHVKYDQK